MKFKTKKTLLLSFLLCSQILLSSCTTESPNDENISTTEKNTITENTIGNIATTENAITTTAPLPEPDLVEGDYNYVILPDGTAKITRYSGEDEVLDIPSSLNGYTVTKIGNSAFYVSVGTQSNLKSVTIPNSVTEIGVNAFSMCKNLTNIKIPESVKKFGSNLFDGTPFIDNHKDDLIIINNHLIKYKGNEESVIIPENVVEILRMAFYNNKTIKNVTIPDNCIIGDSAFVGCINLSDITIPESVDKIGKEAFEATQFLVNKLSTDIYVVINNILVHTNQQFVLRDVVIPESIGIVKIGSGAFNKNEKLFSVIIPDGVTKIDNWAFFKCLYLKSITIPDSVIEIEEDAFLDCINLTISCSEGSYAQQYCIENSIEFEII